MVKLVAIGAGGFLGAIGRYLIGRLLGKIWRGKFPLGTFVVNMLGCFALGLLVGKPHFLATLMDGSVRAAISVGFMGSFTTFSTFMYESFMLGERGNWSLGAANIVLSLAAGLFLAWLAIYRF